MAAPSFKATPEADDRATDATDDAVRGGRHKRRVRREEEGGILDFGTILFFFGLAAEGGKANKPVLS